MIPPFFLITLSYAFIINYQVEVRIGYLKA